MSSLILSGQLPTTWLVSTNQLARQQIEKEGETVEKISWSSGTKTRTNLPTTSSHQQTNYPTCYQANQQKNSVNQRLKKWNWGADVLQIWFLEVLSLVFCSSLVLVSNFLFFFVIVSVLTFERIWTWQLEFVICQVGKLFPLFTMYIYMMIKA